MAQQKTSYLVAGRALGIASLVLAILSVVVFGFCTYSGITLLVETANNPSFFAQSDGSFRDSFVALGLGESFTEAQATWLFLLGFVAMIACGFVFSLIMLYASCVLIAVPRKPEKGYRAFVWAIIAGVVALISLRFISGILLIIAALLVRKDFLNRVGEETEYANAKHLGAMRLVLVLSIFSLISNAIFLVFVTQTSSYNAAYWVSFVQMILMAVTVWVLVGRKQYGCQIIIGLVIVYLIIDLAVQLFTGNFQPGTYIASIIWPVIMLIYFATSKRAKALLVQPFHATNAEEMLTKEEKLWNPKSPLFWRNLLLYFCIFSVVGHWMEYGVCWLIRLGVVPGTYDPNSGIWHDMLNPFFVYGAAFVFIGLLLYPFKLFLQRKTGNLWVSLVLSFVANTLFCAVIELAMGLAVNDHLQLWDYSTMAFNFMGQICLLNTTFFGIMATLMTWLVYPNLERAFVRIPRDVMNIITVVVIVFFVMVVCMYVINVALPGNLNAVMGEMVRAY